MMPSAMHKHDKARIPVDQPMFLVRSKTKNHTVIGNKPTKYSFTSVLRLLNFSTQQRISIILLVTQRSELYFAA